jgi:3-oxoacyl-[acyl-carrier protein] reductase
MKLRDKIALVTGAGRGIGRATALRLAADGCSIIVTDIDKQSAKNVAKDVASNGCCSLAIGADVSKLPEVDNMVSEALRKFGKIDILVNNAGTVTSPAFAADMKEDDWRRVLEVHLYGTFYCTRAVARSMMKQRNGRIINTSSVAWLTGLVGDAAYCAAKAGIVGFTRTVAKELGPYGITVNAIAPGVIDTEMNRPVLDNPDIRKALIRDTPVRRIGTPEDIAEVSAFLSLPEAGFINGQTIIVDGGSNLWNRFDEVWLAASPE